MGALRRAAPVPVPSARPFLKRPRPQFVDAAATCGTAAREKPPARHPAGTGEEFPMRDPKRAKVTCNGVVGSVSVDAALGTLRKRMAAELDAVRALLRKAELLSGGKNSRSMAAAKQRSEAPVEEEASVKLKPPPAKRGKESAAPLAKTANLESRDLDLPDDKDELIDICGGVSPVAIQSVSPLVAAEKACESGDGESSRDLPEDGSEFIDICGGVSPDVSIEKKAVNIPAPPAAVLPEKNGGRSVQPPPEPAASEVVRSTAEQEELTKGKKRAAPAAVSTAALVAKAKVRRTLLEMERAVVPDESILPRDLKDLCIVEYGRVSIMQRLGLFLKANA